MTFKPSPEKHFIQMVLIELIKVEGVTCSFQPGCFGNFPHIQQGIAQLSLSSVFQQFVVVVVFDENELFGYF